MAEDEEDDAEFLLDEFDASDEDLDEDAGLELGDAQAEEIRQIFLTTLPQYVEPLRELIEQVLSREDVEESLLGTLATTVTSILEAAERIGVDDASRPLRVMRDLVKELSLLGPEEVREELLATLREVESLSGPSAAPTSRTIVSALQSVEGLEPSILARLTASGLVTVSQLESAKKHEIIAVTGLSEEAVDALLRALDIHPAARPNDPTREAIDPELERHLREQVAAEEELVAERAEVQRLGAGIGRLERELAGARALRDNLRNLEQGAALRVATALRERADAREVVSGLSDRRDELEAALRRLRERVHTLGGMREERQRERERQAEMLRDLRERVQRLLRSTGDPK